MEALHTETTFVLHLLSQFCGGSAFFLKRGLFPRSLRGWGGQKNAAACIAPRQSLQNGRDISISDV